MNFMNGKGTAKIYGPANATPCKPVKTHPDNIDCY